MLQKSEYLDYFYETKLAWKINWNKHLLLPGLMFTVIHYHSCYQGPLLLLPLLFLVTFHVQFTESCLKGCFPTHGKLKIKRIWLSASVFSSVSYYSVLSPVPQQSCQWGDPGFLCEFNILVAACSVIAQIWSLILYCRKKFSSHAECTADTNAFVTFYGLKLNDA